MGDKHFIPNELPMSIYRTQGVADALSRLLMKHHVFRHLSHRPHPK